MCGSLKLEGELNSIRIHGYVPSLNIEGAERKDPYKWVGWARVDGSRNGSKTFADQWPKDKQKVVTITGVSHFTEMNRKLNQEVKFSSKERQIVAIIDSHGELRILTRPARPGTERETHHRMPVTVSNSMGRAGFLKFLNEKLGTNYE
jgi:hypothetical protein